MKYINLSLLFIAGIAKAIMDTLQFHFSISIFKGINDQFLDASISWENKYSNPHILDTFSDGWHISQSIFLTLLFASISFYRPIIIKSKSLWVSNVLVDFIIMRSIFGLGFVAFYNYILIK